MTFKTISDFDEPLPRRVFQSWKNTDVRTESGDAPLSPADSGVGGPQGAGTRSSVSGAGGFPEDSSAHKPHN